jgi:hypothetical protein
MITPPVRRVDTDERPEAQALFAQLKQALPELRELLESCEKLGVHEDGLYRFYHQSMKVFSLQDWTSRVVSTLRALAPDRPLNPFFEAILKDGTGHTLSLADNDRRLEITRPIVEAFLHAKYFLEMAVHYGKTLEAPPAHAIPSGWAAVLYFYNLR